LTTERVVTRFEKGRPIRSWQPKRDGERNEALDTFVYALAALHGLISMGMRLNEEAGMSLCELERSKDRNHAIIRSKWVIS
jgi:phage terminase large subunit GpA-like protein